MLRTLVGRSAIRAAARRSTISRRPSPRRLKSSKPVHVETFPPSRTNTILNICPQGNVIVRERFGRLQQVHEAGLFFAIPLIDRLTYQVDMRELTIPINPQSAITKDNVSVDIGGALFVQVTDATKACYNVRRVLTAVQTHGISAMRTAIGSVELDELLHNRGRLNSQLRESLQPAADPWGLIVKRYELTEIHPDRQVSAAMDAQATAERRRRETILNAEAVREKQIKESEGKRIELENIAEGNKRQVVLEAEAEKERQILTAQADKEKQILEAEGQAQALERVSKALGQPMGPESMNYDLATKYLNALRSGLHDSSTVFLGENLGNVPEVLAKGSTVIQQMMKARTTPPTS